MYILLTRKFGVSRTQETENQVEVSSYDEQVSL